MAIQAKARRARRTSTRRSPAIASRSSAVRHGRHVRDKNDGPSLYTKAMRYLSGLADFERLRIVRYNNTNFNLERMRLLLKKLGNPQDQFKSVHIAGTKGKGSTCAMVASMLQACGYKVGMYTRPHLTDIRERIQINGELISRNDFAHVVRHIQPIANKIKPLPTYFDVLTAAAFKYFAAQGIDIAVVEMGLGGRLDSRNGIKAEVTGITSICK